MRSFLEEQKLTVSSTPTILHQSHHMLLSWGWQRGVLAPIWVWSLWLCPCKAIWSFCDSLLSLSLLFMIPQGLFSLWLTFQKPRLVDQTVQIPQPGTNSGLLVPSQEKFLQKKLEGRCREKLNIHTSMHSLMEENNLLIANNFYFQLIRKAVSGTGQAILHGKTINKSRKQSQQTWVTNLQRNMSRGKNTPMKKAGLGMMIPQGKSIGPKSQSDGDDRAILWG